MKVRDGVGKWLLRRVIEGTVPETVLTRPKQGFGVPLERWFRRELAHRMDELLAPSNAIYEWFEPSRVRGLVMEHRTHRRDHSGTIWRLMLLDLWLRALARGALARAVQPHDFLEEYLNRASR
jgi:asparagine synthase (glutamine-hydrolysing)